MDGLHAKYEDALSLWSGMEALAMNLEERAGGE